MGQCGAFIDFGRGVVFYGCKSIERYSSREIILVFRSERIILCGENFSLSSLFNGEISVTGELKSLCIERSCEGDRK